MSIIEWAKDNWKDLAKVGGAAAKYYIDSKDQKRRNAIEEAAYNEYMKQVEAAGQEAQAAIDLNLMPMTVANVPTTKADVSDFTAVAARGGLMNLPTRQRKRYASQGFVEDDEIEIMEPESLGDFELQKEEGVPIGPMAAFPDTGSPMSNARQVWDSGQIDQGIYQMDFNIFFQSGDWMDYISKEEVQGDMQMASAPGIAGLRHGGRPGYKDSNITEFMTEEEASIGNPGNAEMYKEEIILASDPDWESEWEDLYQNYKAKQIKLGLDFVDKETFMMDYQENMAKGGITGLKKGGRPGYAQGSGIMNLGGLEKDYRFSGGFVPIGEYERKDDVPARLSKNEFVMTADAVRAAGGGSINKGAQRMYDTMKHLEARPEAKRMTA
jgi:hypothetical protein